MHGPWGRRESDATEASKHTCKHIDPKQVEIKRF